MRINAIVCRIIRQFLRDKRTLGLLIIAPMLVLTLMNFVFTDEDAKLNIGVESKDVEQIVASMKKDNDITILKKEDAKIQIESKKLDAYISGNESELNILLNNSDSSIAAQVGRNVSESIKDYMSNKAEESKKAMEEIKSNPMMNIPMQIKSPEITIDNYYGTDEMNTLDYIGPLLIGLFIFFFVFLISGVSFLRERTTGTLERLLTSPIKRYEIVLGYLIGFGIFTIVQSALIASYSIWVLKIYNAGNLLLILLISTIIALCALSLGMFISSYANNELQVVQFIPIVLVPQIFFCGLFPIRGMVDALKIFSKCMPLTYASNALTQVMTCGATFSDVSFDLLVLIGFTVVFAILNVIALKKHRIW